MLTDCRNGTSAESIIACLSQDALWTWFNVFIALAKKRGGGEKLSLQNIKVFYIFALQKQMKACYPKSSLFSIRNDSASTVTQ